MHFSDERWLDEPRTEHRRWSSCGAALCSEGKTARPGVGQRLGAQRRCSTQLDAARRCSTQLAAARRYSTQLDAARRCSSLLDAARRSSTLLDAARRRRCSTLLDTARRCSTPTLLVAARRSSTLLTSSAEVRLRCVQNGLVVRPARCFFTPPLSNFLRDSFKPPRAEHDRTI